MATINLFGNLPSLELFLLAGKCSSCLIQTGPLTVLSGTQTNQRDTTSLALNTKIDARLWASKVHTLIPASFPSDQPLRIGSLGNLCWYGGVIIGDAPPDTDWVDMHDVYSTLVKPGSGGDATQIQFLKTFDGGDAVSFDVQIDTNWSLCGCWIKYARDDAVENDFLNQGIINDCFIDGCYGFASSQSYTTVLSGNANVFTVKNSLIRGQATDRPFVTNPIPGWEGFWKWDASDGGYSKPNGPLIICDNNIFRADSRNGESNSAGVFLFPPASKYLASSGANNFLIWMVPAAVPETVPSGWTVLSGQAGLDKWNNAVTAWKNNHPQTMPDAFAPIVSLFQPNPIIGIGNTTLSGTASPLIATAEDDTGVVGVQFVLGGVDIGTEQTAPTLYNSTPVDVKKIDAFTKYRILFDTTSKANGPYTLQARARDLAGNSTLSSGIGVTISN